MLNARVRRRVGPVADGRVVGPARRRGGRRHGRIRSPRRSAVACATGARALLVRSRRAPRVGPIVPVVAAVGLLVVVVAVPAMAAQHVHSHDDAATTRARRGCGIGIGVDRRTRTPDVHTDGSTTRSAPTTARRSCRSPTPGSPMVSGRGPRSCSVSTRAAMLGAVPRPASTSRPPATCGSATVGAPAATSTSCTRTYMHRRTRARPAAHRVDRAAAPGRRRRSRWSPRCTSSSGARRSPRRPTIAGIADPVARPPEPLLGRHRHQARRDRA